VPPFPLYSVAYDKIIYIALTALLAYPYVMYSINPKVKATI